MPQHKKKAPEPERKSNPYLGWIALLAVVAAVAVFLFTRQGEETPPAPPAQSTVAQQSQPAQPAASVPEHSAPAPQTQTAPAKSAPQTAAAPKQVKREPAPVPVPPPVPAPAPSPVSAQQKPDYRMPAYFENPDEAEPLAPTLDPATVPAHAREAYDVAKRKPRLLAQLPCFCYCDRSGHKSLHDCYVGVHAQECDICMREALEADQMDNQGMTPQEIRAAIVANHHPRTQ